MGASEAEEELGEGPLGKEVGAALHRFQPHNSIHAIDNNPLSLVQKLVHVCTNPPIIFSEASDC